MVPPLLHPRSQGIFGEGRVAIKVLLIVDNVPGHPQSISIKDENAQVVFLPPNMASLLHLLDHGMIRCVKASYTRHVFEMIQISYYVQHLVLSMVSRNCGRSWNILLVDTGALLYFTSVVSHRNIRVFLNVPLYYSLRGQEI
jgi:hypothetical protein